MLKLKALHSRRWIRWVIHLVYLIAMTGVFWINREYLLPMLIAIVLGVALLLVAYHLQARRKLRRQADENRPATEAALDAMLEVASKQPPEALRKVVLFNRRGQPEGGLSFWDLCMNEGVCHFSLAVITDRKGRIRVTMQVPPPDVLQPVPQVHWPAWLEWAQPEPWLSGRLERLQSIVGDASWFHDVKRRVAELSGAAEEGEPKADASEASSEKTDAAGT